MKIQKIANTTGGQDGAIWGGFLFRFDTRGGCHVFNIGELKNGGAVNEASFFQLDKSDILMPHSNAVMFGNEYFSPDDEFPLLYSNIYNSYASFEDKMEGTCCVYRIVRNGTEFTTTLVQVIKIGFADNCDYWKSCENDIRPYGNFTIDRENSMYYAFTMRDKTKTARYFSFRLPKLSEGEKSNDLNARVVVLETKDIKEYFDCEYHKFIQGACFHDGKIYSLEGFEDENTRPVLRIINVKNKCMERYVDLWDMGYRHEPEFIDFLGDDCWYGDGSGNLFTIDFSE